MVSESLEIPLGIRFEAAVEVELLRNPAVQGNKLCMLVPETNHQLSHEQNLFILSAARPSKES